VNVPGVFSAATVSVETDADPMAAFVLATVRKMAEPSTSTVGVLLVVTQSSRPNDRKRSRDVRRSDTIRRDGLFGSLVNH